MLNPICSDFTTMGSPCQIRLYAHSDEFGKSVISKMIHKLYQLNDKYTRYHSDSLTSKINASAGSDKAIKVDAETEAILNYAQVCYQQSDGLFDITSGVLRKAWNFSNNQLPEQKKIDRLLSLVGWHKIKWQPPFILLPKKGMEIDFGGVVKEYAADAVIAIAQQHEIKHGLIDLGGDIRSIGPLPNGEPWSVHVQHPRNPEKKLVKINLDYGGISTSGDYERYMIINGKRYSHIINPKIGWPIKKGYASVTVLADHCVIAGSATTVAMLKGVDALTWLEELTLPYWCVDDQGNVHTNTNA